MIARGRGGNTEAARQPRSAWQRLGEALCNLLFPPQCVACGTHGSWLCSSCIARIEFVKPPWVQASLIGGISPLQGLRAAARLSGPLQKAIHSFKYKGLRALAPALGEMLYQCWEAQSWPVDVIVPVPLHASRLRQRGYNQSALLARELARRSDLPVTEQVLLRVIATRPQVGLNATERAENVRHAFRCCDSSLRGLQVLLVDDVLTTGATLRACARALLQGKARAVWGLTLAHG